MTTTPAEKKNPADKMQDWYVDNLCSILRTKLERMILAAKNTIYTRQSLPNAAALLGEFIGVWDALVSLQHTPDSVRAPAAIISAERFAILCRSISDTITLSQLSTALDDSFGDDCTPLSVRCVNELRAIGINTLYDLVNTPAVKLFSGKHLSEVSLDNVINWVADIAATVLAEKHVNPRAAPPSPRVAMDTPLANFEFTVRARKTMLRLGCATIGDLLNKSAAELCADKNFGDFSLAHVQERLAEYGLQLRADDAAQNRRKSVPKPVEKKTRRSEHR
jgi:DNA-directed RNA polymerase alpha subunit